MSAAKPLTVNEIRRLKKIVLSGRHAERNWAIVCTALSGLRINEVVSIKNSLVFNADKTIKDEIILEKHLTKSKKSRWVFLNKNAVEALKEYANVKKNFSDELPVFESQKDMHKQISSNSAQKILKKYFKLANIDNSSHACRKFAANELRKANVNLVVIQQILGHANLSTTSRYFQAEPMEMKEAISSINF